MEDLGILIDDHDALDAMVDQLIVISRGRTADAAQCHGLLRRFADRLTAHLAAEAGFIYDAHVHAAHGTAAADMFAAETVSFEADFAELAANWNIYLGRWTCPAIAADRAGFAQETIDMMTALKLRIARENGVLYPLALESGCIPMRA